jgi:phosphoribosylformylglycinamidine synthase
MFAIEIFTKNSFKDSRGQRILADIILLGVKDVRKVNYCSLYIIEGNLLLNEVKMITSCLLSDTITENYTIAQCDIKGSCFNYSFASKAMIEVSYKKGVTDTVSSSVIKAVKDLGISKKIEVKTGSRYYLSGKLSQVILDNIACNLLANTLIQEYKIRAIK